AGGVTVEKTGPASAALGQRIPYVIVVRNEGSTPARRIRVEDDVPAQARLVSAKPQPVFQGGRGVGMGDSLLPSQESRFEVELEPITPGEMLSRAAVLLASSSVRVTVAGGVTTERLSMTLTAPPAVRVGQNVELTLRLSNSCSETLSALLLRV